MKAFHLFFYWKFRFFKKYTNFNKTETILCYGKNGKKREGEQKRTNSKETGMKETRMEKKGEKRCGSDSCGG